VRARHEHVRATFFTVRLRRTNTGCRSLGMTSNMSLEHLYQCHLLAPHRTLTRQQTTSWEAIKQVLEPCCTQTSMFTDTVQHLECGSTRCSVQSAPHSSSRSGFKSRYPAFPGRVRMSVFHHLRQKKTLRYNLLETPLRSWHQPRCLINISALPCLHVW
jgi:hypothetical protein